MEPFSVLQKVMEPVWFGKWSMTLVSSAWFVSQRGFIGSWVSVWGVFVCALSIQSYNQSEGFWWQIPKLKMWVNTNRSVCVIVRSASMCGLLHDAGNVSVEGIQVKSYSTAVEFCKSIHLHPCRPWRQAPLHKIAIAGVSGGHRCIDGLLQKGMHKVLSVLGSWIWWVKKMGYHWTTKVGISLGTVWHF